MLIRRPRRAAGKVSVSVSKHMESDEFPVIRLGWDDPGRGVADVHDGGPVSVRPAQAELSERHDGCGVGADRWDDPAGEARRHRADGGPA